MSVLNVGSGVINVMGNKPDTVFLLNPFKVATTVREDIVLYRPVAAGKTWWSKLKAKVINEWQQRAIRFLTKHGSLHQVEKKIDPKVEYSRVDIDVKRVIDQIAEHTRVVEYIFNRKCDVLVVGREVMRSIHMSTENMIVYNVSHNQPSQLLGLHIVFVPWFDGVVAFDSRELRSHM